MATVPVDRNRVPVAGDPSVPVAIGALPGWQIFRKFGNNPAVNGSSTLEEMWPLGTPRILPTAAAAGAAVSTSTADANPSGTGARTIQVEGLDADYNEISEVVSLNGTTPVVLANTYLRINRAYVLHCGTGMTNAGAITIYIGADPQAYIQTGKGQTLQTFGTLPANKNWIITNYSLGVGRMAGTSDCVFEGWIRLYDPTALDNYQGWRTISSIYLYNGQTYTNANTATIIPARTDYKVTVTSSAATQAHAIISGFLVDDTVGM